jgi:hypothetical protein
MNGDIILVRHKTLMAEGIVTAQEALTLTEPELKEHTWCDHSAFIRYQNQQAWVSEIGPRGYERRDLYSYVDKLYCVINLTCAPVQRNTALLYDQSCEDLDYGYAEYFPLVLDGLTWAKFSGSWGDAIICSTQVTLLGMAMGLFPDREPTGVAPAHISLWFDAKPPDTLLVAA